MRNAFGEGHVQLFYINVCGCSGNWKCLFRVWLDGLIWFRRPLLRAAFPYVYAYAHVYV